MGSPPQVDRAACTNTAPRQLGYAVLIAMKSAALHQGATAD